MDGADLNRIEHDQESRRAEIDATLREIEDRFTVRTMSDSAWHYVQDSVIGEYGENLRYTVGRNPIPATLLGVSLAWLMLGGQRASGRIGARIGGSLEESGDIAGDAAARAGRGVAEGGEALREAGEEAAAGARAAGAALGHSAQSLGHSAQSALHQARRASQNYSRMIQDHPLATGVMGLAVGAAIAAMIPETEAEDRAMGEARDRMAGQAAEKGRKLAEGAQATAQAGLRAAQEEAQRQAGAAQGEQAREEESRETSGGKQEEAQRRGTGTGRS